MLVGIKFLNNKNSEHKYSDSDTPTYRVVPSNQLLLLLMTTQNIIPYQPGSGNVA